MSLATDDALRTLVAISAQALLDSQTRPADIPDDLLGYSPRTIARMLVPLLQATDASVNVQQIQNLLQDEALGRQICLKYPDEVSNDPYLAEGIGSAYEARMNKMAVPESLLLAGASVILAIRLKEIHWSSDEKIIKFDKASDIVRNFLLGLLKSGG
ncbi:MAG: hypothetical protein ACU83N_15125 [Gammaproteobacteria bacterium]